MHGWMTDRLRYEINKPHFSKENAGIKMDNAQRFCLQQEIQTASGEATRVCGFSTYISDTSSVPHSCESGISYGHLLNQLLEYLTTLEVRLKNILFSVTDPPKLMQKKIFAKKPEITERLQVQRNTIFVFLCHLFDTGTHIKLSPPTPPPVSDFNQICLRPKK